MPKSNDILMVYTSYYYETFKKIPAPVLTVTGITLNQLINIFQLLCYQ